MKKITVVITALALTLGMAGCQFATRNCGGNTTLELEPNQKLEEITYSLRLELDICNFFF